MARTDWQAETDVLVIGAGGCGLVAALTADDLGAEVIVVEKEGRVAGSTALSNGTVAAAGTRFQLEVGIEDSPELMAEDILRQAGTQDNRALVHRLCQASKELVEWLVDGVAVDMRLIGDYKHVGHSVQRLHAPPSRMGIDLVRMLEQAAGKREIIVGTSSPVDRLEADDDGNVIGAVIASGGSDEAIRAKKVILACCGFGANREMVRRYCPDIGEAAYYGHPGNTGEGIRWGVALGAGLRNMAAYQGYAAIAYPYGSILSWTSIEKGGLLVNLAGERFVDETHGYSGCTSAVLAQPGDLVYVVFDARIRSFLVGHEVEFRDMVAAGVVREAADTAELAAAFKLDEAALDATIRAFNESAAGNVGDRFGRRDFGFAPLQPPFCVAQAVGGLLHTQGGLTIDREARVIRPDGSPIGNLYAGGGAAEGISGSNGGMGYSSGCGLLTAMGLGRIAGRHAAQTIRDSL